MPPCPGGFLASMLSSSSLTNQLGRFPSAMGRPSFPAFKTYGGGLVVLTAFVVGSLATVGGGDVAAAVSAAATASVGMDGATTGDGDGDGVSTQLGSAGMEDFW